MPGKLIIFTVLFNCICTRNFPAAGAIRMLKNTTTMQTCRWREKKCCVGMKNRCRMSYSIRCAIRERLSTSEICFALSNIFFCLAILFYRTMCVFIVWIYDTILLKRKFYFHIFHLAIFHMELWFVQEGGVRQEAGIPSKLFYSCVRVFFSSHYLRLGKLDNFSWRDKKSVEDREEAEIRRICVRLQTSKHSRFTRMEYFSAQNTFIATTNCATHGASFALVLT